MHDPGGIGRGVEKWPPSTVAQPVASRATEKRAQVVATIPDTMDQSGGGRPFRHTEVRRGSLATSARDRFT
jgi:hypothetical protein